MTRIIFENIVFFLMPTIAYVAFIAFKRDTWPGLGAVIANAPLLYLFAAGAAIMFTMLVLLLKPSGGKPGEAYEPPSVKNGQVEPGHMSPAKK